MTPKEKALAVVRKQHDKLERAKAAIEGMPLRTPLRIKYCTRTCEVSTGIWRDDTVEAMGVATAHNGSSFRFQWAAINNKGSVAWPFCRAGEVSFDSYKDRSLPYVMVESWQPIEPRELPLLVGWGHRTEYLNRMFAGG